MRVFLLIIGYLFAHTALSQCCSGGVPMSGNLGMPHVAGSSLQFSLNYDLNVLHTFKQGDQNLNDDSRSRITHSVLLETGYAFTDKLSVDGLFTWVNQQRIIENTPGNKETTSTQGIGDATLLVKYNVWNELLLGAGVKMPLGQSDQKNEQGLNLSADLQPGSGAWDQIYYISYANQLANRPTFTFFGTGIYRLTGTNDEYLDNSTYTFGNEVQMLAGASDQFFIFNQLLETSLRFRGRIAQRDEFNDFEVISSGGEFLFINPGVSLNITPNMTYQFNMEWPLYARVNEAQVSPSFRINTGFYFFISKNDPDF